MEPGHVVGAHGLMAAGERGPQTQAESSPPSTTAWLVRFPPGAAVHQTDSLSLHLTTRHPVAPRAELWIPPFPLGHGVPAHDIS